MKPNMWRYIFWYFDVTNISVYVEIVGIICLNAKNIVRDVLLQEQISKSKCTRSATDFWKAEVYFLSCNVILYIIICDPNL